MYQCAVFLRGSGDQKSDAAAKRKAFPFRVLKVLGELGEGGGLKLGICARRQIKDRDRYLAVGILETGKTRARLEVARQLEADPGAGRIYWFCSCQDGKCQQSGRGRQ